MFGGLLHCGISIRSMSALGHSLPIDAPPADAACPLRPKADKSADIALSPLCADFVAKVIDGFRSK
jgi:hypothetical protein